jgi:hypothetical protein
MVERSVEQSVPPAGSGPHDFTTARLSMALMHAASAAGVVEEKRLASLEGFVVIDTILGLNPLTQLLERPFRVPLSG